MSAMINRPSRSSCNAFVVCGLLMATLLLGGCASGPQEQSQVKIEIQENVGFTITEEAGISSAARETYQAAQILLSQQQHTEAAELLKQLVSEEPQLSAPRIDLAITYQKLDQLNLAEEQLLQVLEQNPEHPVALNELGIVYRKTGRFAEARTSYEKSLAVYPGFHIARRNLAVLCDLYLDDLKCALDNYEAYMATVAEDPDVAIWIADVRYRIKE
jgi:tetratricopeptide (TPR) repeat protein